ncbi:MAG: sodium/solute symporter [Planctomycetota bacterium]
MHTIDIVVFALFAISVVAIGLYKSRGEKQTAEDYFLAGRGLTWPLIGISLIAANISAEQMVGMSGAAANGEMGFAIASYEWMAAITLVVVGFTFLPTFLKAGIYTIPQFLDYRYGTLARTVMSVLMFITFVLVNISTVTYLGAKFLDPYVDLGGLDIQVLSWAVGLIAGIYIAVGGLKASAWADLIQGTALVIGGAVVTVLAINALGTPDVEKGMNDAASVAASLGVDPSAGVGERLASLKEDKMHMFLPKTHDAIPWTALLIGLWIPNFYYWGLNQYIVQRTLGSKTLAEGQKGIVFAASLKLVIPFVVCVPGIIAFTLYSGQMAAKADEDTNTAIVEVFQSEPGQSVFPFRDDFAERDYELAEDMFDHNLSVVGGDRAALLAGAEGEDPQEAEPRTAGEVLAVANDTLLAAAPEGVERQPMLVGYDYDDAFPLLVQLLVPIGLKGFVIAAVMGAVVSSLASMMNAASTIFTVDIYQKFLNPKASQKQMVWTGRLTVVVATVIGCLVAPLINNPALKGAFNFIQEFQGFISPGILTIFLFGLFVPRAPRLAGAVGLVLSPVIYGALFLVTKNTDFEPGSLANLLIDPFLNRMAITIIVIATVLGLMTVLKPLPEPIQLPEQEGMEITGSKGAKIVGLGVVLATVALYIIFA